MKNTLLVIALSLLSFLVAAQSVDIELMEQDAVRTVIHLTPNVTTNAILANVVFTLQWPQVGYGPMLLGTPSCDITTFELVGEPQAHMGSVYQVLVSLEVGSTSLYEGQPVIITIPLSGTAPLSIAGDQYTDSVLNGKFYVSLGGQDATGSILFNQSTGITSPSSDSSWYYDIDTRQLLIKRDTRFFNLLGEQVIKTNQGVVLTFPK